MHSHQDTVGTLLYQSNAWLPDARIFCLNVNGNSPFLRVPPSTFTSRIQTTAILPWHICVLVFVFVIKLTLSHPGPRGASNLKGFRGWPDLSFRFVIERFNVLTTTAKVVFGLLCEAGNTTWKWLILSCTPLSPSSAKGDGKYHEFLCNL